MIDDWDKNDYDDDKNDYDDYENDNQNKNCTKFLSDVRYAYNFIYYAHLYLHRTEDFTCPPER